MLRAFGREGCGATLALPFAVQRTLVADPVTEGQPYSDRREAGTELARVLAWLKGRGDVVVLALPRGGVPVASEVARALRVLLDVFLVRKLGLPGHPELAMGAIASGGVRVLNSEVRSCYQIPEAIIDAVARSEQLELERCERAYRNGRPLPELRDRVVVLVDDGIATGSTMKAAVVAVRAHKPSRIIVAVPIGAADTCRDLEDVADEVVCARSPDRFGAVGEWYGDFSPTTDEEVQAFLRDAQAVSRGS